ncbi:MAG: hypothetical protein MEQ07_03570 [Aquimonas sp.]|nr:hypothetical protein [Aquimonas sp.]
MTPFIDPAQLRPGDVLLMKGIGAVSDLIAWFGDSSYSHAALMVDGGAFVEAALPVSRRVMLVDRLKQSDHYDFIDVYRPTQSSGRPLQDAERATITDAATALLGVDYPLDALLQMAVFAGLRNRIPADKGLRWLLREILDHLVKQDPKHMVCSELVYSALRNASQAPALIISAQLDLPVPKINVTELIKEWLQAHGKSLASAAAIGPHEAAENELAERFAQLRAQRAGLAKQAALALPALGMPPVLDANPKNVLPVDLETSPQLRLMGRLPLGQ